MDEIANRLDCAFYATFQAMNARVIVWDLETVPDLRGFAAANNLAGKTDEDVRSAMGEKFPKHIYHSRVCIGALGWRTGRKITGPLMPSGTLHPPHMHDRAGEVDLIPPKLGQA